MVKSRWAAGMHKKFDLMRALVALQFALAWSLLCGAPRADDWPQWRGPGRDGVWHESGIVEQFVAPRIAVRWRTGISSGYSGPTVADGRVYVSDYVREPQQTERVHCLDSESRHSDFCSFPTSGRRDSHSSPSNKLTRSPCAPHVRDDRVLKSVCLGFRQTTRARGDAPRAGTPTEKAATK